MEHPADYSVPSARSVRLEDERVRLRKVVERKQLVGLANDTKWDELLAAMRTSSPWRPAFRFKCIDDDLVTRWDWEWFYHLPFPLMSIEWLDIADLEELVEFRIPKPCVIDHAPEVIALLTRIGLDFVKGERMIRIFGYAPRSLALFDAG